MKKLLLGVLLSVLSCLAYSQSASITIVNHSTVCGYHVTLYAIDPPSGNLSPCDIMTNDIYVPPGVTWSRSDPDDVNTSGPGYNYTAAAVTYSLVTDWS